MTNRNWTKSVVIEVWTGVKMWEQVWKGLNRFEQVRTGVNRCEQVWRGMNRCEQVWTGVDRCEQAWKGLNRFEQVSTVFPRPWVARCPNFAYPSTKLHQLYTFGKPLNVCGMPRVLLYIHSFETLLNIFLKAFQPILLRKYMGKQRLKDKNSGIMRADMEWIVT